jgi:four helix bundle protein
MYSQKEINETLYWLELLKATAYLTTEQFEDINPHAVEIIKIITTSSKQQSPTLTINN